MQHTCANVLTIGFSDFRQIFGICCRHFHHHKIIAILCLFASRRAILCLLFGASFGGSLCGRQFEINLIVGSWHTLSKITSTVRMQDLCSPSTLLCSLGKVWDIKKKASCSPQNTWDIGFSMGSTKPPAQKWTLKLNHFHEKKFICLLFSHSIPTAFIPYEPVGLRGPQLNLSRHYKA